MLSYQISQKKSGNIYFLTDTKELYADLEVGASVTRIKYTPDDYVKSSGGSISGDLSVAGSLAVSGVDIPENANLNTSTYFMQGMYNCKTNAIATTLTGCPTTKGFRLETTVYGTETNPSTANYYYCIQRIVDYPGNRYYRSVTKSSGKWNVGKWVTEPTIIPYLTRSSLGVTTTETEDYLKAWVKHVWANYKLVLNEGVPVLSGGNPNSFVSIYGYIYTTSTTIDGYPEHCVFTCTRLNNPTIRFGTVNGQWYMNNDGTPTATQGTLLTSSVPTASPTTVAQLIIPRDGFWLINAGCQFDTSHTASCYINLLGAENDPIVRGTMSGGGGLSITVLQSASADTIIQMKVYQASGSTVGVNKVRFRAIQLY